MDRKTLAGVVLTLLLVLNVSSIPPSVSAAPTPSTPPQPQALPQTGSSSIRRLLPLLLGASRPSTSLQLIDRALANGSITAETALIYKVFWLFADSRLPAHYHGDDSLVGDVPLMGDLAERFNSLSPATQDVLYPFLIPPYYQNSWWDIRRRGQLQPPPPLQPDYGPPGSMLLSDWGYIDSKNGKVRVWYQRQSAPTDAGKAQSMADAIDAPIWLALTSILMGREPLSDNGSTLPFHGGDDRLDISLVDISRSATTPYNLLCGPSPVFMLFNRQKGLTELVHELMHAIQFSYKVSQGCYPSSPEYRWLADATAEWAKDYVYPKANDEQVFAPAFLDAPDKPLETSDDRHEYGAYLYFFYLAHKFRPQLVRTVWEATESNNSLEAVNSAMPFVNTWAEFVRLNWNQPPVDQYKQWDNLTVGAKAANTYNVTLNGAPGAEQGLKADLPHLTAAYYDIVFSDANARSVYFENPFGDGSDPAAHVQALVKRAGHDWEAAQDWSNQRSQLFCRDTTTERLEELVLIFSNSEAHDRSHTLHPAKDPKLFVNNIGCWRYQGSITSTMHWTGQGRDLTETATFDPITLECANSFTFDYTQCSATQSTVTWTRSGNSGDCTFEGSANHIPWSNGLMFVSVKTGTVNSRSYTAGGSAEFPGTETVTCPGSRQTYSYLVMRPWLMPTGTFQVKPDGRITDAETDSMPGFSVTYAWDLHPLKE